MPVNGWHPELVFLIIVFSDSTNLALVLPNSTNLALMFPKSSVLTKVLH